MEAELFVENAHAPYIEANALWEDDLTGHEYTERLITCIEDCVTYEIPTFVVHPTNGKTPLPVSNIGIERLKRIIDRAENLNINIALENMESPQYLEYVFSRIQSNSQIGLDFVLIVGIIIYTHQILTYSVYMVINLWLCTCTIIMAKMTCMRFRF